MVILAEIIFKLDKYHHIPLFSTILSRCKRRDDERGFLYFFIGIIVTLLIFGFNTAIAYSAILMLLLGDAASTIIGRKYGSHKLPFNKYKSFEGSITFFLVGFAGSLIFLPILPAFIGSIGGMLTEAYSPIDDNITVPVISALIITVVVYCL